MSLPAPAHSDRQHDVVSSPTPTRCSGSHPPLGSPEFHALLRSLSTEFATSAAHYDRTAEFPFENFKRLNDHKLLSLVVPQSYGGSGGALIDAYKVVNAVGRAEPATALVLAIHYFTVNSLLKPRWPEHLRHRLARDFVQDGALINAFRTEPDMGSPTRGAKPKTIAKKVAGGWLISGQKIYTTGIPILTWIVVWAAPDREGYAPGHWIVHRDSPGIQVIESWDHLGMRATASHEVVFNDVFVPDELDLDGESGDFYQTDKELGLWSGVLFSAIYDGVAQAGRDWVISWLRRRIERSGGAGVSNLPRYHEALGYIDALLFNNRLILTAAARGEVPPAEIGNVKYLATNNAIKAVEKAVEISGNPGLSRSNALERLHRNVLCARIHGPHDDQHLSGIGKIALENETSNPSSKINQ